MACLAVGFVRAQYDLARAAEAIEKSDLPDRSAEYLRTGGKPADRSADASAG